MNKFNDLCSNGEVSGPRSEIDIMQAEKELGVEFPKQYRDFLSQFGSALLDGVEIYGLPDPGKNNPPIWQNVVAVTRQLRGWGQIGADRTGLVPITDDGTGIYFFLDTNDSPSTTIVAIGPGVEKKVSSDFFDFIINLSEGKVTL